jgi:hypothetical protein
MWSTCSRAENAPQLCFRQVVRAEPEEETMAISGAARTLPVLGRMAGVVAVSITLVVVVWLSQYAVSRGEPWWDVGAGLLPLTFLLRLALAGWVGWAAVRFDERALLRVLLAAFAVSFLLLYGWYFLLLGYGEGSSTWPWPPTFSTWPARS